jgi:nucleoside 2-deoxyribosyltransferase
LEKVAVLSHWVRSKHENNIRGEDHREIVLDRELIKSIIKNPPPTPAEQADKFVLWLGNSKHPPGELVSVEPATHQSIIGAITPEGFELVLYYLMDRGILYGNKVEVNGSPGIARVTLSFEGWQYYERLKRSAIDSRKAFMAMKYGDEQLDKIVEEVFKPAVKQTGFDLFKLVDRPQPAGLIDDILRVEIQTSRFLIADLTHNNLGAYWEAGYAEGLGKPVIYTCEKSKFEKDPPHFDTNHHLTIPWDEKNIEEAAAKLKATIRATLPEQAKLTDD